MSFHLENVSTAWKASLFGAILVNTFPYSVQMRENADQNNSEYGHFLRSDHHSNKLDLKSPENCVWSYVPKSDWGPETAR